jgi:formate dehydrogenase accessory protein FdhD
MGRITARRPAVRMSSTGAQALPRVETLAVEEPLELRIDGRPLTVTMRTPGSDLDLAAGFLLAEGVVRAGGDIKTMRYCAGTDSAGRQTYNVLDIVLAEGVAPPDASVERAFITTSACGLCGAAGIEAVRRRSAYDVSGDPLQVTPQLLACLPEALRREQATFDRTGGLHAAALFDSAGRLLCAREDVGRHNAVDKVLGWALSAGEVPATGRLLMVSGRASFELAQKAFMAGVPLLAAVSAPSSLAAELAAEVGMTLVGFLRGETMNVYSGAARVTSTITTASTPSAPLR